LRRKHRSHHSRAMNIPYPIETPTPKLSHFSQVVCAGGGNRCWWQAGVLGVLSDAGMAQPKIVVGTSAGAAIATAWITETIEHSLEACKRLYGENDRVFRWRPKHNEARFAQTKIYPEWINSVLSPADFEKLKGVSTRLIVAVTRPSPWLGQRLSVGIATLMYLADKCFGKQLHPNAAKRMGLSHELFELADSPNHDQACNVLVASAAAPPFIPARYINEKIALDGGYVDSMPITSPRLTNTLVLMSRYRRDLPSLFEHKERTYWQPSAPVPVSTWDCTPSATVDDAYDLGVNDARALISQNRISV